VSMQSQSLYISILVMTSENTTGHLVQILSITFAIKVVLFQYVPINFEFQRRKGKFIVSFD
jgi:hypothetical protein